MEPKTFEVIYRGESATIHEGTGLLLQPGKNTIASEADFKVVLADGTCEEWATLEKQPADLRQDGPTLEEFIAAGYKAENYPPPGYAEKPSPGLDAYRAGPPAAEPSTTAEAQPGVTIPPGEGALVDPVPAAAAEGDVDAPATSSEPAV